MNVVQELNGATPTANLLTSLGIDETLLRTDATGARSFLADGLGSTLALTDAAGLVQSEYTYEPFGKTTASGVASTNAFKYTGREDDGTGLYYYRARYYHPGLQRFIRQDPLGFAGGDTNLYAYVGNEPIDRVDPFGLWGAGIMFGGSVEAGVGAVGAGATGSVGGGVFGGGAQGVNLGGFGSFGGFAGGPGYGPSYPGGDSGNAAVGAFGGAGGGPFATNATCAADLKGPFNTYSFNLGIGPLKFSFQFGESGGTWIGSFSFGPGIGVSGSAYPTNTWAK